MQPNYYIVDDTKNRARYHILSLIPLDLSAQLMWVSEWCRVSGKGRPAKNCNAIINVFNEAFHPSMRLKEI